MNSNNTVDEIINREIAAKALKIASADYASAEAAYRDAEFKWNKLCQFRQDYQDRFHQEMQAFIPAEVQQGFRSFFLRLDAVILEQQHIVEDCKQQFQVKRHLLQEIRGKQPSAQLADYALI